MDEPQNLNPESTVLAEEPLRESTSEITPASPGSKHSAYVQEEGGELLLPETVLRDLLCISGIISSTDGQEPHNSLKADTLQGSSSGSVTPRRIAHYDVFRMSWDRRIRAGLSGF